MGNPVVTVNVGGYGSDNLVVASAFRAVGVANQPVPANTNVKVLFPEEQFDLANEYNPVTSTFTPRHNGVYLISGTVSFNPNNHAVNYRVLVAIRVNGDPYVAADNDFFGPSNNNNVVNVSTILNLKAGDHVDIIVNSGIAGEVAPNIPGVTSTHFEGARFPSPRT
ncbi:C1q-like domain-containing protein [Paenibacillus marinisediminis]